MKYIIYKLIDDIKSILLLNYVDFKSIKKFDLTNQISDIKRLFSVGDVGIKENAFRRWSIVSSIGALVVTTMAIKQIDLAVYVAINVASLFLICMLYAGVYMDFFVLVVVAFFVAVSIYFIVIFKLSIVLIIIAIMYFASKFATGSKLFLK